MCGLEFAMMTCLTILPFGEMTKSTALPLISARGVEAEGGNIDVAVGTDGEAFDAALHAGRGDEVRQNGQHLDGAALPCASRCRRENSDHEPERGRTDFEFVSCLASLWGFKNPGARITIGCACMIALRWGCTEAVSAV